MGLHAVELQLNIGHALVSGVGAGRENIGEVDAGAA